MKLDSIEIKDVRGIRDLTLDLRQRSFVISGPNGSGKSGVVDAIEFCLTGEISRLSGKGTAGVTVHRHGPHIEHRADGAEAEVTMHIRLLELGRSAVITRTMRRPRELRVEPEDPEIVAAVDELSRHPELVLSRREVITEVRVIA